MVEICVISPEDRGDRAGTVSRTVPRVGHCMAPWAQGSQGDTQEEEWWQRLARVCDIYCMQVSWRARERKNTEADKKQSASSCLFIWNAHELDVLG